MAVAEQKAALCPLLASSDPPSPTPPDKHRKAETVKGDSPPGAAIDACVSPKKQYEQVNGLYTLQWQNISFH